jgi:hypothetical protein
MRSSRVSAVLTAAVCAGFGPGAADFGVVAVDGGVGGGVGATGGEGGASAGADADADAVAVGLSVGFLLTVLLRESEVEFFDRGFACSREMSRGGCADVPGGGTGEEFSWVFGGRWVLSQAVFSR